MLLQIILLTTLGSIVSLCGGIILLMKKSWSHSLALVLSSFAAGVLLATAFLDLLPEAAHHLEEIGGGDVFLPTFLGIILFFLLERTLLWFHHHHFHEEHQEHMVKPSVWTITLGDGLHNFIDGIAIASAFLINPTLGITTALAVAAHEIPQEIADFSILLSGGLSKKKAILFNLASAGTAVLGAVLTYFMAETLESLLGMIIAFTAGMFMYIALSDLIPELHHTHNKKEAFPQILVFIIGILVVYTFVTFGPAH